MTDSIIYTLLNEVRALRALIEAQAAKESADAEELERLRESECNRAAWLARAKEQRGYHQNASFDRVWAETCELADLARMHFGALRPFADLGNTTLEVLPDTAHGGWCWGGHEQDQKITTWLGPTDFGTAMEAYAEHQRRVLRHLDKELNIRNIDKDQAND